MPFRERTTSLLLISVGALGGVSGGRLLGNKLRGRDLESSYNCADGNSPCDGDWDGEVDGYFFPHNDGQMYVTCDSWGSCFDMPCPEGTVWNQDITSCVHDCDTGPCSNPCTAEAIEYQEFYHHYCEDEKKFVQCDEWGGCFVMDCAPGTVWSQEALTCVNDCSMALGGCQNPCTLSNIANNGLYHELCGDDTQYVQCDEWGGCYVMPCPEDQIWDYQQKTCVHDPNKAIVPPDGGGVVKVCEEGRHYSHEFHGCVRSCDIPDDEENPCTKENIDNGELYHEHWSKDHKFIMCDEGGGCTVEKCGEGIWNQRKEKCVSEEYTGCERDRNRSGGKGKGKSGKGKSGSGSSKSSKSTKGSSRAEWQEGCKDRSIRSGKGKGKGKGKGGSKSGSKITTSSGRSRRRI